MSHNPERSRKPSVEDLLRLKRSERPDADFWKNFERGLREKQLAAIVEPKPWWLGLSILLGKIPAGGWAATAVSAGAAAAFAIMAVTTQTTSTTPGDLARQTPEVTATTSAPVVVASSPTAAPHVETTDPSPSLPISLEFAETAPAPTLAASEPAPAPEPVPTAPAAVSGEPTTLPANATILLAAADARPPAPNDSLTLQPAPSFLDQAEARLDRIATPLLEIVASGFSTAPAMITGLAPASVPALASSPATNEPELSEALSPRHARLLNAIAYEAEEKDLAQARDRVVHRLSTGEELYASVTRLGVRGDRLSVSF